LPIGSILLLNSLLSWWLLPSCRRFSRHADFESQQERSEVLFLRFPLTCIAGLRLESYCYVYGVMFPCQVWQGLDRLSFFENAVLLELKYRSQGKPVKMRTNKSSQDLGSAANKRDPLLQMTHDFLDDFALVASGPGGPDNVSAVCMEISDQDQIVVLRVARNGGSSEEALCHLRSIIQIVIKSGSTGSLTKLITASCFPQPLLFHVPLLIKS